MRVYHQDAFLCRAICSELANQTISLKEVVLQARRARRRQLQGQLRDRVEVVEQFLKVHQPEPQPPAPEPEPSSPRLKRYYNE